MKKFIAILISMLCALGSLSFVGCGKSAGGANTLQIWCNEAGYGTQWITDALELFVQQDWVKEKYPEGVKYDKVDTAGNATSGLEWLVGGGTQYDIVMPTGGLSNGTFIESYRQFEDLTELYNTQIPGESNTILEKMIPEVAAGTELTIKGEEEPWRVSIPWINGAHGWFYNETSLKEYLTIYNNANGSQFINGAGEITMPRTTDEFIEMLEEIKAAILIKVGGDSKKVNDWAIFHHTNSVSYWTGDACVWWAQYDGVDGYNNYFLGQNENGEVDYDVAAENTVSTGRLRALEVLDSIINYDNGYVYQKYSTERNSYTVTLGRIAQGNQFVFSSNGDWIENETKNYATEGEVIRMMKTPVISSIVEKLSFSESGNADEVLSLLIKYIDAGTDYNETSTQMIQEGAQVTEDDYNTVKLARNTVMRTSGHGMYIPSYSDAKELAKDFMLFLASDAGIESMMSNGIYSSYVYDYSAKPEVTANLTQMRKDFIEIMNDARDAGGMLRNAESFPSVYYGKFSSFSSSLNPHIGSLFLATTAGSRKTPQEVLDSCAKNGAAMSTYLNVAN